MCAFKSNVFGAVGAFPPLLVFVYQQIFLKRFMINHKPLQQDLFGFRILAQLVLTTLACY